MRAGATANWKIPLVTCGRAFFLRSVVSAVISCSLRTGSGSPIGNGTTIVES